MQFTDQLSQRYDRYNPEQKNYLNLGLTLGLLIILIVLIYPAIQHILSLQKELSDGKIVLNSLREKISALDKAEENYNDTKDDIALLDSALPSGSDLKDYIKNPLEKLAVSHNLSLNSLQFNEVPLSLPKEEETLIERSLDYSVVVNGNFIDFNKFLADLEKFIRTTQVSSVTLTSIQNGGVTANIKATTNYLGQSAGLNKIAPTQTSGGTP